MSSIPFPLGCYIPSPYTFPAIPVLRLPTSSGSFSCRIQGRETHPPTPRGLHLRWGFLPAGGQWRSTGTASVRCSAGSGRDAGEVVKTKSVSVVLLAGGKGKRMGANLPKQFLPLLGQPLVLYSFYTFAVLKEVKEIVIVCDPSYKVIFEDVEEETGVTVKFALPGKERQDSVYNGFQEIAEDSELVCVHDSARPLASVQDIRKVLKDALRNGAAVLGVPVKATIKEADNRCFVVRTLDRKILWEMQTPQVMTPKLLREGFELVNKEGLEVTDDVSIIEHLKHPVYITEGSYTNIKVTTPDDLLLAERILNHDDEVGVKRYR